LIELNQLNYTPTVPKQVSFPTCPSFCGLCTLPCRHTVISRYQREHSTLLQTARPPPQQPPKAQSTPSLAMITIKCKDTNLDPLPIKVSLVHGFPKLSKHFSMPNFTNPFHRLGSLADRDSTTPISWSIARSEWWRRPTENRLMP